MCVVVNMPTSACKNYKLMCVACLTGICILTVQKLSKSTPDLRYDSLARTEQTVDGARSDESVGTSFIRLFATFIKNTTDIRNMDEQKVVLLVQKLRALAHDFQYQIQPQTEQTIHENVSDIQNTADIRNVGVQNTSLLVQKTNASATESVSSFQLQREQTVHKGVGEEFICAPFVNLFTTFIETTTDIRKIAAQEAVLLSLTRLKPFGVQSWLFTKSDLWARKAEATQILTVREFQTNGYGTPVLSDMFSHVINRSHHKSLYCDPYSPRKNEIVFDGYFNGDIVFSLSLVKTLNAIRQHWNRKLMMETNEDILVVGKRTNVDFFPYLKVDSEESVLKLSRRGQIFQADALDYFIYSRGARNWTTVPKFVIGRRSYDNWLVDNAYHNGKTGD